MKPLRIAKLTSLLAGMLITFALGLSATTSLAQGNVGTSESGPAPSGMDAVITAGHYGLIANRADVVLSANSPPTKFAADVFSALQADPESFFVVDIRSTGDYCGGHIPGAVNIPFRTVAMPANLEMLPTDTPIVVVCYTGHTASQTTMLYNLLGYEAYALRFAMISWVYVTDTKVSSPLDVQAIYGGSYDLNMDCAP